ncbi:uncharacterized protein At5g41620-like [Magnolia sinica]|uniref:uncharacterized protein At5g41620-like n=1 Tax=Magnolia sinica TaxID=86752 RepID=UPI0026593FD0|nr:uncharacterized protein At5g41620-like [Magnolia sinica]
MEEGEKGSGILGEKREFLGIKLRRGILVGKKGGPCTPVPTWRFGGAHDNKHGLIIPPLSSRKLAANLWDYHQLPPPAKMSRGVRIRHHKDKGLHLPTTHPDDSPHSPPDKPASAGSLRRHVAASLMQHHKSIERSRRVLQPFSPASYGSSMEIAAYNPAITPTSSLDFKGRLGEVGYSLKTSAELLKVLNRIWTLEEQHASNVSLVKSLKMELAHSRARIQELMHERQADRHEIDDLMKQVAEDKLIRKSKVQDKIKAAVQSVRDELEDERKLRRRSESLHRKLARELSEVKSAFSKALKELERERKMRLLLEDLCDEFARGVGDYEKEVRALKHKAEKDHDSKDDRLILHVSEAWLDERAQMKHAEARSDLAKKDTIVDRLRSEIETFLRAKRSKVSKNDAVYPEDAARKDVLRRQSLESVHFNGAGSAPQGDDDSMASDLHGFALNKNIGDNESNNRSKLHGDRGAEDLEEMKKSYSGKKRLGSCEKIRGRSLSSLQVQFEEHMERAESCKQNKTQTMDRAQGSHSDIIVEAGGDKSNQIEINISHRPENYEAQEGIHERKGKPNHIHDNLIRTQSSFSEDSKVRPENDHRDDSCSHFSCRGHSVTGPKDNASGDSLGLSSPVQQWNFRHTSPDLEISESSLKWPRGLKENTLKAKLLEARLEGQHARLKTSKGP